MQMVGSPRSGATAELNPAEFARLSELLDESIEMTVEERHHWLTDLEHRDPKAAAALRQVLASVDACREQGFLETRDLLARHLARPSGADPAIIGKQFGPYRVVSLLGHGGMGGVWLAERIDGLFTRQVALKLLHPALMGRVMAERLAREREILASLNHPNIARLFDAGFAEDGQPYLALEYVLGTPLTTHCDTHCLSIRERLELFRQVLSAVQYAHAHLVIHRDLKPSNILVTEEGQIKLLDFGIAKLLIEGAAKETELTQLGGRALTPEYAAPEQILGAPITTAADVYALGVMLYELLTGERPYRLKRESRGALEEAILKENPLALGRVAPGEIAARARATTARKLTKVLKGDLETVASKALKKTPAERYATANALDEDIARFLRGDVVLAQRDSVAYRAVKFARRHRVAIAAASALALTLAGGLAATSYEARVAATQRDAALQAQSRAVTQTAAARLKDADAPGAMGIILELLPHRGANRPYTPEALNVFQEARAADANVLAFTGHAFAVRTAVFSPDGRHIVTASMDKTARIWDAVTGRQIMVLSGHTDWVRSAAFSPDGRRVVTAAYDKTARIWDTETGQQITLLSGHTDRLRSAAFSPDGRRVVTAAYDYTARIWDAATGQQSMVLNGHTNVVNSAAYSPDGGHIVTASGDQTARTWDAATGRQLMVLSGHTASINTAEFSPDGGRIVTASDDKTSRIWEAGTGRQLMMLSGHTTFEASAAFSSDGRRVVSASDDTTASIWDAATGRLIKRLSGHTNFVNSAGFSPDGRFVVTASDDKTARIWDGAAGAEIMLLNGHTGAVESAAYSPDGERIITASEDKSARIWDAAAGREVLALNGHAQAVNSAAFSADGRRAVTASFDKTARVWDAATGRLILTLSGHKQLVVCAAFSPDGRRIVTASTDMTARVWDAATGLQLVQLAGHSNSLNWIAFSPDGRRVVSASFDKTARIWDAATGRLIVVLRGHTQEVTSAAFSSDGRRVVTASNDRSARVWDAATGRQIMLLSGHTGLVNWAGFSPDGQVIMTASSDKTARIWDAATGQQLKVLMHADIVESAGSSPDGQRIVTASDDRIARIWDARAPAIDVQISWAAAAQFDPLSDTERVQLGLPLAAGVRQWPTDRSRCDESAAAPYDPERHAAGAMLQQINADVAVGACAEQNGSPGGTAQSMYQRGRAQMAIGNFAAAKQDFEHALAAGYRAAGIDLGVLLSAPSSGMLDLPRAISLYEQAWNASVTVAGFELGNLYERGVARTDNQNEYVLAPDTSRAWFWYQKAAEVGEPNALARVAERADDAAFSEGNAAKRHSDWLESFKYYAAAAERARIENWPDDAWRNWRYRRASLAHLLAREGMMRDVADVYGSVRGKYAPPPTMWQRLGASASGD
jgi:WD40 repeat protein